METTDARYVDFNAYRGTVDLVSAGVPCQPFSQAGRLEGHRDDRNLFPVIIDAVREIRPRAVIIENVRALVGPRFESYFEYIVRQLRAPSLTRRRGEQWRSHLGRLRDQTVSHRAGPNFAYNVASTVVQAADFGVPQLRARVFIVAFRQDLDLNWVSPYADANCRSAMCGRDELLYAKWIDGSYWRDHGLRRPVRIPESVRKHVEELRLGHPPTGKRWRTVRDAIADLDGTGRLIRDHQMQSGARAYDGHQGSPMDWPSKTIKAGVHGVAGGENMLRHANGTVRYFTVREAARLQGFPDSFSFGEHRWGPGLRQVGNAVPVPVAELVGRQVARALGAERLRRTRHSA